MPAVPGAAIKFPDFSRIAPRPGRNKSSSLTSVFDFTCGFLWITVMPQTGPLPSEWLGRIGNPGMDGLGVGAESTFHYIR